MNKTVQSNSSFLLPDGRSLSIRPVRPDDQPLIAESFRTASRRTLLHRFFTPLQALAPEELRRMLVLDPVREFCFVGELAEAGQRRIICGARYVRSSDPTRAEIAITIHDDFQKQGIGHQLLKLLVERGRADGIRTFVADVLAENTAMLHLLQKLAPHRQSSFSDGVCHVEFEAADAKLT